MSRDPTASVAASALGQGRAVHLLSLALALVGAGLGPRWIAGVAVALAAVETGLAVRVGLDAALFGQIAEGLDRRAVDSGLVEAGLLPSIPADRPIAARVAGAMRLLRFQVAVVAAQALVALVAAAVGR